MYNFNRDGLFLHRYTVRLLVEILLVISLLRWSWYILFSVRRDDSFLLQIQIIFRHVDDNFCVDGLGPESTCRLPTASDSRYDNITTQSASTREKSNKLTKKEVENLLDRMG